MKNGVKFCTHHFFSSLPHIHWITVTPDIVLCISLILKEIIFSLLLNWSSFTINPSIHWCAVVIWSCLYAGIEHLSTIELIEMLPFIHSSTQPQPKHLLFVRDFIFLYKFYVQNLKPLIMIIITKICNYSK